MSTGMAGDIGTFVGAIAGTLLFSWIFSLIYKAITKIDSTKQRVISTSIVTFLYILIQPRAYKDDGMNVIIGMIMFCLLAWLIVVSFFALKFRFKQFLASLFYGLIFWVVLINLIVLCMALFHLIERNFVAILSTIIIGISFVLAVFLTFKQRLPFTKVGGA